MKMENAVIYARYSSQGQNEQSIDGQVRICREYADSKGFNIVKIYTDKARSAWADGDKRVDFQKMIADAGKGVFQHIIVYKFDRFARNRLDSQMYKQRLKKEYGIRVLSATEPVSDDEGGEIYEMFLEWNDEKYSQRLSKRVRDGFDTSVANGNFTGGVVIWGYKLEREPIPNKPNKFTTKIVVDPEPAETIKFIFDEYARGIDKKEIARTLNAKGLRYMGKEFQGRTFDKWLSNTKYYGLFTFGGRENTNIYPPIITKEIFDKVQERLKHNRYFTRTNHTPEKYLLTGKVFCGECGSLMTADGANKKNQIYRYYGCKTARKGKCNKKLEKKEPLEDFVIRGVLDYLKDEYAVSKMADNLIKYYEQRTDETAIKSIETRIQHTEQQIEITTNAFIQAVAIKNDLLIKNCDTKIKELQTLADDLKKQHTQLQFEQGVHATKDEVITFIHELLTQPQDESKQDFYKRMIDCIVSAVYVYDRHTIVWFNFDSNKDIKLPTQSKIDEYTKKAELNGSASDDGGRG